MDQSQALPGPGKGSLVSGLIFGVLVGTIDSLYSVYLYAVNPPFVQNLFQGATDPFANTVATFVVNLPIYLLLFIAFVLAGLLASRKTKSSKTGLLAGLWTGVFFVLIDLLVANIAVIELIAFPQISQSLAGVVPTAAQEQIKNDLLNFSVEYSLVAGLIVIGIGMGLGTLGGLWGKRRGGSVQPSSAFPASANQPYQAYQGPFPNQPSQGYQGPFPNQPSQPYQGPPYPFEPPSGQGSQPPVFPNS